MPTNAEYIRAALEDAAVDRALAQADRASPVATTPESIEAGDASIAAAYRDAPARLQQRIENKELLTAEEFCGAVGVDVDWLDGALFDGRVFALTAPTGCSYYPAFYSDAGLKRADIERVAQVLAGVEPISQYTFFFRAWTLLGTTPLDALRAGRLDDVLRTAMGFVEDAPKRTPPR